MSYTQFNPHSKGLQDLNLTADEVNRFSEALKKKEFIDMMGDYMKEISDPANKAEYDQYLKQLERDNDLPQGTQLVHPSVGFCIKTNLLSNENKKSTQKLFINICFHNQVQPPTSEDSKQGQQKGQQWKIPYIAGKVRLDQTNKSEVCTTIEVCYHDLVMQYAASNKEFQKLVCETAIEGAQKQVKERNETVSKDYKIMQNLSCKGGKPATLTVRTQFLQNPSQAQEFEKEMEKSDTAGPKLFQEFMKAQKNREEEKAQEKKEATKVETQEQEEPVKRIKKLNAPQYKILYSYETEYEDFLDASKKKRKLPKSIMVCIDLPDAEGVANLKLDINGKLMIFEIPKKHYLEIKLPYDVDQDAGDAKYDKKNKTLRVKLPLSKNNVFEDLKKENFQNIDQPDDQKQVFQKNNENLLQTLSQEQQFVQEDLKQDQKINQDIIEDNKIIQNDQMNQDNNSLLEIFQKENMLNIYKEKNIEQNKEQKTIIEILENKIVQEQKVQKKELQISRLEFRSQETNEYYFLTFNIPKYNKAGINHLIADQKIRISYQDDNMILYQSLIIENQFDLSQSEFNLVTDYVTVKIKKINEETWNNSCQINQETYEEFDYQLVQHQKHLQDQENEKLYQKQKEEEEKIKRQFMKQYEEDQLENQQFEQKQDENIEVYENKKDPSMNQIQKIANSLQFIEYQCPFAFSLD